MCWDSNHELHVLQIATKDLGARTVLVAWENTTDLTVYLANVSLEHVMTLAKVMAAVSVKKVGKVLTAPNARPNTALTSLLMDDTSTIWLLSLSHSSITPSLTPLQVIWTFLTLSLSFLWNFSDKILAYFVNLGAHTNTECGEIPSSVCQYITNSKENISLADATTQVIRDSSINPGAGVDMYYTNGTYCATMMKPRTTLISLSCVEGAPTTVQSVAEDPICSYHISMTSGLICPNCTAGNHPFYHKLHLATITTFM